MISIAVEQLSMTYRAPVRAAGLRAALRALVQPEYRAIEAVRDLSFVINAGEVVGFIGPNGAGKTTTLKLLSGILHPTRGTARVLGHLPARREYALLRRIALIRGSQPIGGPAELTVMDSLYFQQLLYEVSAADFRRNLGELVALLNLEPLLERQIRALSLGERMRAGLALALLYRPQVLFLDEPTIGLDVTAVQMMRRFITAYSQTTGATVLLTSHYMADVETLCNRIILIHKGRLAYDGALAALATTISPYKLVNLVVSDTEPRDWGQFGEVVALEGSTVALRVLRSAVPMVTARLLAEVPVVDLAVENPPLEHVIDRVYREGVA
jgi:ABC-2 type transport system ATP-binding protein